jgi:hypothetical protein
MILVGSGGTWWDLVGKSGKKVGKSGIWWDFGGIWWNYLIPRTATTSHLWHYSGGSLKNQRNCTGEYRGRCAAQKKRSATKKPSSSSVVSLLVLKFARFLFICPVLETPWSSISEIQEGPCVQSTIAQGGPSTNNTLFPASPGFVSCSRHPQGARGGRAQGRGWAWGTTRGRARPPRGLFGERGLGRGGDKSRLFCVALGAS